MQVKIKKLHPNATVPTYATDGSACFDLYSAQTDDLIRIFDCNPQPIPTELSFEVPDGHVMLIFSRSGHGFKNGVRLSNCVGVIDADYRGQVVVKLHCDNAHSFMEIRKGDRIAQAMILPVQQVRFEVVDELSSTERGTGGFGSTGQ